MMRIRSPSRPDHDGIADLIRRGPFRPEEISCALELLAAALEQTDSYEALITEDPTTGAPIGYACFGATPMTASTFDLYWIAVATAAQGRGVGRQLLAEVESRLAARGCLTLRIETSSLEGEGGAARFYERAGFERVGRIDDFYRPGDHLITFAKRLL
jgi:ribosomal protein S18 acetylase RimI-like enzyme